MGAIPAWHLPTAPFCGGATIMPMGYHWPMSESHSLPPAAVHRFLNNSQQRVLVQGHVSRLARSHSSRAYVTKVVGKPRGLTTSGLFSFQGVNIPPLFPPLRLCRNAVVAQRP